MKRITLQRRPILYAVTTCAVLVLHAYLCYPAGVSRGYPPIQPFEIIAVFLAPIGMLLPPLFDDFCNDRKARIWRTVLVTTGFCLIWAVVHINLSDVRPHIGHLVGPVGILQSHP